jgi:hypothetical protein
MSERAKSLAQRIQAIADEVLEVVRGCSPEDWGKRCEAEDWPAGVTARHIAAGHFETLGLTRMMVRGDPLPQFTREQVVSMANAHAREHAGCTPEEVIEILSRSAAALVDYVAGLEDSELDRKGSFIGREMSVQQFLEAVILQSGGNHLASVRTAIAGG